MSRVLTFSRTFPSYHPRKGEPTFFVEKIFTDLFLQHDIDNSNMDEPLLENEIKNYYTKTWEPKGHTIRSGNRWKVGDYFSPRVWGDDINPKSGKKGAYHSKQIIIAPAIEVKKVWNIRIWRESKLNWRVYINGKIIAAPKITTLALNAEAIEFVKANINYDFDLIDVSDIHWQHIGYVEVEKSDYESSHYPTHEFYKVKGEKLNYMRQDDDGEFHNLVWQTSGHCEDDYSGFLLFPLSNGLYWKISYYC